MSLAKQKIKKICLVQVEEHFDAGQVTDYSVETLEELVYRGTQAQGEYRVLCGMKGDVICFTAKNTETNCEQSKCFFLENLETGTIVMPSGSRINYLTV